MIKAIETSYSGYRFRSRLEARWAVFFDVMGIRWTYESEGFEVTGHHSKPIRYLPDFLLLETTTYVEIKPVYPPSESEMKKIIAVTAHGDLDVLLLYGPEAGGNYGAALFLGRDNPNHFRLIDRLQFSTCPICNTAGVYRVPEIDGPSIFRCFNQSCQGYSHLEIKKEVDWLTTRVQEAIVAARSARFEYSKTPKVLRGKPKN